MNKITSKILVIIGCIMAVATTAKAQSEVTFKVNLQPQLKDSVFIPGHHQIYLKGNQFPLSPSRKVYLDDKAPIDSVYEATVNFSPTAVGEKLTYNFYIQTPEKIRKEQMPRHITLLSGKKELDVLYFNSFAW